MQPLMLGVHRGGAIPTGDACGVRGGIITKGNTSGARNGVDACGESLRARGTIVCDNHPWSCTPIGPPNGSASGEHTAMHPNLRASSAPRYHVQTRGVYDQCPVEKPVTGPGAASSCKIIILVDFSASHGLHVLSWSSHHNRACMLTIRRGKAAAAVVDGGGRRELDGMDHGLCPEKVF